MAETIDGLTCVVTGAAGFLGQHLVAALVSRGCPVRAIDLAQPTVLPEGVSWTQGDICDASVVSALCDGADVVFHTAAIIDLAKLAPRKAAARAWSVNVDGTKGLLAAAQAAGVTRFVHTSSTNVVFGQQVRGGDERGPWSTSEDLYSSTKVAAEQAVLAADVEGGLRTCAIRPGGIYGPGERKTIVGPLLESIASGAPVITFGNGKSLLDYAYIDSLVDAQLQAADRLFTGSSVCGQSYFISDGTPVNPGEFSMTLARLATGSEPRRMRIPQAVGRGIGWLMELGYVATGKRPPLMRVHVDLASTDNYFSIDKARRELAYVPRVDTAEGLRLTAVDARSYFEGLSAAS